MKLHIAKAVGVAAAGSAALVLGTGVASASTTNGSVTILAGSQQGAPVPAGTVEPANFNFGVKLQASPTIQGTQNGFANCSADSATGGTYVYTFLIPANQDIHNDDFRTGDPGVITGDPNTANDSLSIIDNDGTAETTNQDQQTAPGTGEIVIPPQIKFNWDQIVDPNGFGFSPSVLTGTNGGKWVAGYACQKSGVTTDYWSTPVNFVANSSDPYGFNWFVPSSPGTPLPEVGLPVLLPLGGVGLIAGGVYFTRRRRQAAA